MSMVPYIPGRMARDMVAQAFNTTGNRHGRRAPGVPDIYRQRMLQPIVPATDVLSGLCCDDMSYEDAKRFGLGAVSTQSTAGGAASGAATGASLGSAIPIVGTAVGAILGAVGGAIAGSLNKKDPEQYNFDAAVALWQQNPNAVYNIGNKYLPLAGLFDLRLKNPHIPIYQRYGRMGEQRFVNDLVTLVYNAGRSGQISPNDTALSIMSRIVQPWIDSFGFGQMQDPHADLINRLIIGMVNDYISGVWRNEWFARGGDFPFSNLPAFSLPQPVAPPPPPAVIAPAPAPVQPRPVLTIQPLPALPTLIPTPAPGAQTLPAAIMQPQCTAPLVWNGTQCVMPNPQPGAPAPPAAAVPVATVATAPPAGFSIVGADLSGNPVFANAQGVLYQWNGTAMQLFTGQLAPSQNISTQIQSALQQALAQGQSAQQAAQTALAQAQSQGANVSGASLPALTTQAQQTATAPVTTAGVSSGGMGWVAAAVGVLALLFATARPARGSHA